MNEGHVKCEHQEISKFSEKIMSKREKKRVYVTLIVNVTISKLDKKKS